MPLYDQGDNHKQLNNILFKVCPSQTFIYKDGYSDFYFFKSVCPQVRDVLCCAWEIGITLGPEQ